MVDDKKLNMQFVLADLYEIQGKTYNELNSTDIIPTYNKVILILSSLIEYFKKKIYVLFFRW